MSDFDEIDNLRDRLAHHIERGIVLADALENAESRIEELEKALVQQAITQREQRIGLDDFKCGMGLGI